MGCSASSKTTFIMSELLLNKLFDPPLSRSIKALSNACSDKVSRKYHVTW